MQPIPAGPLLLIVTLLTACAAQQPVPEPTQLASAAPDEQTLQEIKLNVKVIPLSPTRTPSGDELVCVTARPTGSHIPERRCITRAQQRRQNREAQEWLRSGGNLGSVTGIPTTR